MEPEPICEGDEYSIAVTEGDLSDAQSLAIQLVSEGNCVSMQTLPPEGDDPAEDGTSAAPAEVLPLEYPPR